MRKIRILSLDGGGIRGVIPATVMNYVEQQIICLSGNPHARIADYFDFVAGTSTGGILSALYLTPNPSKAENEPSSKFTAADALAFYAQEGFEIFNKSKRYGWFGIRQLFDAAKFDPAKIESLLFEKFGHLTMRDLLLPCIITTYNMANRSSVFFNSRETNPDREFLLRDVVRSTSAAPTYFPPAFIKNLKKPSQNTMINIDGGVFANNPAICAYAECRQTQFKQLHLPKSDPYPAIKDMFIVSVGTGTGEAPIDKKEKSHRWSILRWAQSIPEIMMDGGADTVNFQMERIFETVKDSNHKVNYKRIDVPMQYRRDYDGDMTNASPENIENLKRAGHRAIAAANQPSKDHYTLDEIIAIIVNEKHNNP